jgi:hypothetical protein
MGDSSLDMSSLSLALLVPGVLLWNLRVLNTRMALGGAVGMGDLHTDHHGNHKAEKH